MARHQSVPMRRFERMSRLRDYTLEKGAPDPRGWKVHDGTANPVGVVRDLVIDTDRMAAAYMDVELDVRTFDLQEDPHILVPMSRAHQDGRDRRLVIPELTRSRVAALYNARAEQDVRFWDGWWRDAGGAETETPVEGRAAALPSDPVRRIEPVRPAEPPVTPVYEDERARRWAHPDERVAARERDIVPERDVPPSRDIMPEREGPSRRDLDPDREFGPRRDMAPDRRRFDE